MKKINLLVFLVVFLAHLWALPFAGCCSQAMATLVDRVVAVVNEEVITLRELQEEVQRGGVYQQQGMRPELSDLQQRERKEQVLESKINNVLFLQEARRLNIHVSDSEVENHLQQMKQQHGLTDQDLQNFLENQNMDIQEYKQWLKEEIKRSRLLSRMVQQKVVVTQEEIEDYYSENKEQFQLPGQVELRLILHHSQNQLQNVREDIVAGELDFGQAARNYSQGPNTARGGHLGVLNWDDLAPAWQNILQELEPGEISEVFSFQDQYALILLQDLQIEDYQPLQEVREEIREKIYERKLEQRYQEYVQNLRSRAAVDIRL